ncbi:MAG: hypothetical protein WB780_12160 [Candidatus Acidiferrales bacterium]
MEPLEKYIEQAPELAQDVVNAWGKVVTAGRRDFTAEFRDLFDKACNYRRAKAISENHREFSMLTERDAAEEVVALSTFAITCKTVWEKHGLDSACLK